MGEDAAIQEAVKRVSHLRTPPSVPVRVEVVIHGSKFFAMVDNDPIERRLSGTTRLIRDNGGNASGVHCKLLEE